MLNLKIVNWWLIAFLSVLIVSAYGWHALDKKAALKAHTVLLNASWTTQVEASRQKAEATTKLLQKGADERKESKYLSLQSINNRLLIDNRELQQRASRPTPQDNSIPPVIGETCTATQLYREDAEFLAGEAARAESVLIERNYYYEQYEAARRASE